MIGDLATWRTSYSALPQVGDDSWKANLANYLGDELDGLLNLQTYVTGGGFPVFTFDRATFQSNLTDGVGTGVAGMQAAFTAAIATSTWVIAIGTKFGVGTPAETFSTPGVAVPDPAGISAGAAKIGELASAAPTSDPDESEFPLKLREAFLLLTYTVTGTNSVAPTPGPISDPLRGVE